MARLRTHSPAQSLIRPLAQAVILIGICSAFVGAFVLFDLDLDRETDEAWPWFLAGFGIVLLGVAIESRAPVIRHRGRPLLQRPLRAKLFRAAGRMFLLLAAIVALRAAWTMHEAFTGLAIRNSLENPFPVDYRVSRSWADKQASLGFFRLRQAVGLLLAGAILLRTTRLPYRSRFRKWISVWVNGAKVRFPGPRVAIMAIALGLLFLILAMPVVYGMPRQNVGSYSTAPDGTQSTTYTTTPRMIWCEAWGNLYAWMWNFLRLLLIAASILTALSFSRRSRI